MKPLLFTFSLIFLLLPVFSLEAAAFIPTKVLLVPGHDNESWGARYGNIKEAAMNLAVARRIHDALKKDQRFEVFITRGADGYEKYFADYLENRREDIIAFRDKAKRVTEEKIRRGEVVEIENTPHNAASEDVSVVLYGINMWANENNIDLVVHIHFNDYNRRTRWVVGNRQGFAVYVPEEIMVNGAASRELGSYILTELDKSYDISNYWPERTGLVPDQKLIAIGSNGSLAPYVRAVLVEYGYIYEKKFHTFSGRNQAYNDMAKLTTSAIKKYFFPVE